MRSTLLGRIGAPGLRGMGTSLSAQIPRQFKPNLRIAIDPPFDEPVRENGLRHLCEALGATYCFQAVGDAEVYYGFDPNRGRQCRAWILPDAELDWTRGSPFLTQFEGIPVLHSGPPPTRLIRRNCIEFDIVMAASMWLTLAGETQNTPRDGHGRVPAAKSLIGRLGLLHRPPLHSYAALLADVLWPDEPPETLLPRWPNDRTWAVALTHDVDRPERPSLGRALLKECIAGRALSRRKAYYALRSEISARGFRESLLAGPARRSEWDFDEYCRVEREHGLCSAFFFAVTNRRIGHPCDVDYDVSQPWYAKQIRALKRRGFEIGLHAAYGTRQGVPTISQQLSRLSDCRAGSIAGVRHHYLQIDPREPMLTLFEHQAAGLDYDSSIGFNDQPGFRAGTALPFAPFHADRPPTRQFVELPMTLADMHLPPKDENEACSIMVRHLERTRDLGGLAVLNWHVGHWRSDPIWRKAYQTACMIVGGDKSAWCATPREIAQWWRLRSERLGIGVQRVSITRPQASPRFDWPPACRVATESSWESADVCDEAMRSDE